MDECIFGIVLTKHKARWNDVIPAAFVYDSYYENAVRKVIDRQLAIKRLSEIDKNVRFTAVGIITDELKISDLILKEIGVESMVHLLEIFDELNIIVCENMPVPNTKLFPAVWHWSSNSMHKREMTAHIKSLNRSNIVV